MSRHRHIRNIDLDDEDYDYDYPDESPQDEMTDEDYAQLQSGLQTVRGTVGDDVPVTDKEIRDMLWETYYDTEQTIAWVLETSTKRAKPKTKQSSVKPAKVTLPILVPESLPAPKPPTTGSFTPQTTSKLSLGQLAKNSRSSQNPLSTLRQLAQHASSGSSPSTGTAQSVTTSRSAMPSSRSPQTLAIPAAVSRSPMFNSHPSSFSQFILQSSSPSVSSQWTKTLDHCAGPSTLQAVYADVLTDPLDTRSTLVTPLLEILHHCFPWVTAPAHAAPAPVEAFKFDQPSRDDVVSQAQNQSTWSGVPSKPEKATSGTVPTATATPKPKPPTVQQTRTQLDKLQIKESPKITQPLPKDKPDGPTLVKSAPRVNPLQAYAQRCKESKERVNLVIVGHVDAGKSTLMGHMLYLLGHIPEKTLQRYQHEAGKAGKSSFHFAWVLDATEEERSRGVTIDVATSEFETPHRHFTILDAPGHRDFIPNMISGTTQADAALLVVDSSVGGFEAGFSDYGQTKEHALLVRSLGVQQLVVAVNKLDTVDWSQSRFIEIEEQVTTFLTQIGFKKETLTFIPCSGLRGINLTARPTSKDDKLRALTQWYQGPCLSEAIDQFRAPPRALEAPLRLSITDFFKGSLTGGSALGAGGAGVTGNLVTVCGRIESGTLQVGEKISLVPGNEQGVVKAIDHHDEMVQWAVAGDNVMVSVQGIDMQMYSTGAVLCALHDLIPTATRFVAQVVVFDPKVPVTQGYPVILHHQSCNEPGFVTKLVAQLERTTGEVIKRKPRHLLKSSAAKIEITTQRPICLDTYDRSKSFGRITLRKGGETVGAGIVLKLKPDKPS
ncbi:hypothetical protein IWQ62_002920 [Dispira parvispora]|uniref:Elongation factor 1 alpha-like protein n=1 Tax=Dispira parvispora TaxID=1520584 RepID=A0A9W8AV50_9FUNG|nr:hypothetical protein IWQ62_002920 [Dispira parvispora]